MGEPSSPHLWGEVPIAFRNKNAEGDGGYCCISHTSVMDEPSPQPPLRFVETLEGSRGHWRAFLMASLCLRFIVIVSFVSLFCFLAFKIKWDVRVGGQALASADAEMRMLRAFPA